MQHNSDRKNLSWVQELETNTNCNPRRGRGLPHNETCRDIKKVMKYGFMGNQDSLGTNNEEKRWGKRKRKERHNALKLQKNP
jgi:hypothetical protein